MFRRHGGLHTADEEVDQGPRIVDQSATVAAEVSCLRAGVKSLRHAIRIAHDGLQNALPTVGRLFRQARVGAERVSGGTGSKFPIDGVFGTVFETLTSNRATLRAELRDRNDC